MVATGTMDRAAMEQTLFRAMVANDETIDSPEEVAKTRAQIKAMPDPLLAMWVQKITQTPVAQRMFKDQPDAQVPTPEQIINAAGPRAGMGGGF